MTTKTPRKLQYVERRKQSDGTWRFRSWVPKGSSGKRKWTHWYADPETALQVRKDTMRVLSTGQVPRKLMTLGQAIEATKVRIKLHRRAGTLRWYECSCKVVEAGLGKDTVLAKLTRADIEAFRDKHLGRISDSRGRKGKPITKSTVESYRRALRTTFKGHGDQFPNGSPMAGVEWPKPDEPDTAYLTQEQTADILWRIRSSGLPFADRDADVIAFAFLTGWRRSEIARLRPQDIDLDQASVLVRGKSRDQRVRLHPEAAAALRRLLPLATDPTAPLIDALAEGGADRPRKAIPETRVSLIFRRWAHLLKEPRLRPHVARHSFATALLRVGLDMAGLKKHMRHATTKALERYLHAGENDLEELARLTLTAAGVQRLRKVE